MALSFSPQKTKKKVKKTPKFFLGRLYNNKLLDIIIIIFANEREKSIIYIIIIYHHHHHRWNQTSGRRRTRTRIASARRRPRLERRRRATGARTKKMRDRKNCRKPEGPSDEELAIASRLAKCKRIVLVLSGKGGVGNRRWHKRWRENSRKARKCAVGLLDIDICGPSVPTMTKKEGADVHKSNSGWQPCT